jgi:hypothetical protein
MSEPQLKSKKNTGEFAFSKKEHPAWKIPSREEEI